MKKIPLTILALGAVVACSEESAVPPPTAPSTSAPTPPPAPADAGPVALDATATSCPLDASSRARFHGTMKHLDGSASPPPLAGVKVCIHGRDDIPCVTTGADGAYDQTCTPTGDVLLRYSLAGFASVLWARTTKAGDDRELSTFLVRDADNQALFSPANVIYPRSGHGMVTVNDATDIDGIQITPVTSAVDGPFYSADAITLALTATGTVGEGYAFFVAPVGDIEIEITAPGGAKCSHHAGGWSGSQAGRVKVPVLENTETSLIVHCP
jgi:hypothetical protein